MRITLGSNIASLNAQRRVGEASVAAGRVFEQLSSGMRINRASDDAAGLAVAEDLNVTSRVLSRAILNINDGQSLLAIADGALSSLGDLVMRMRELTTQSANGTFSSTQRKTIDTEAQALAKEFFRISRSASFNGVNLFDGTLADGLRLQLGYGVDGSIRSSLGGSLGTGTFRQAGTFATQSIASSDIATGDLNGDGILDLVSVGTSIGGTVNVRLGRGDGTFSSETVYQHTMNSLSDVSLSDLNNDGILDIVATGTGGSGGEVSIRLGVGDGSFGSIRTYSAFSTSTSASRGQTGDLNGDGILDLVVGGLSGTSPRLAIRLGNGDGSFAAERTISLVGSSSLSDITLGDINRDGVLDIVTTTGTRTGFTSILLGNGDGTFNYTSSDSLGAVAIGPARLGDLNNDGILDLAFASGGGSALYIRLGNGDGSFNAAQNYGAESLGSSGMILADLNGDGNLDIATSGTNAGNRGEISVRLGTGQGTFGARVSYTSVNGTWAALTSGDLNGDGVIDIVATGAGGATAEAAVFLSNNREGISPILPFSLATRADALQAMGMFERTLNNLSQQRGVLGAFQGRLNVALNTIITGRENVDGAKSRILDADVATTSADLIRVQIVQRAASAVLAQANQQPQIALQILRNSS